MLPELDSLAGHRSTFLHTEYLHDKKMQGSLTRKRKENDYVDATAHGRGYSF